MPLQNRAGWARGWYGLTALLALIGLGIEYGVTLAKDPADPAGRTLVYLSFFTILTNMLVMAASLGRAIARGPLHRWAAKPATRAAISVWILVVAVIFQLLLAGLIPLSPIGWWGNLLVHRLVPALWLAGWAMFPSHGGIARRAPVVWLAYPLLYGAWTIAHGLAAGWYPYPFLDVAKRGGGRVAINMVLMGLFFAALGYAARWIDGRLARSRAQAGDRTKAPA